MTFSYYPLSVIVVFSFMSSLIFIPNAMHLLFKMFNVILVVRNAFFALSIFHSASSFSLSFVEILLSYLFIILLLVLLQIFLLLFPFFTLLVMEILYVFFSFYLTVFADAVGIISNSNAIEIKIRRREVFGWMERNWKIPASFYVSACFKRKISHQDNSFHFAIVGFARRMQHSRRSKRCILLLSILSRRNRSKWTSWRTK